MGPLMIAGPCGVESPEQIMAVAKALEKSQVKVLRGGIWKPRTRPDSFQGIGKQGLSWLKSAGIESGMMVMTEVADPVHIDEAMEAGIDFIWIGARTTVNPFMVQRLADALNGVDIPVFIKNPITPDLELWIGAIERFQRAGISRLAAVHRGFSTYEKSRFRNAPNWHLPIELKRRFPDLPLICDPSHICGTKGLISSVAQTALDLNYDGLMVEVHPDPKQALSDKDQQLTPAEFLEMVSGLLVRKKDCDDVFGRNRLDELRSRIDLLDVELINLIAKRMDIARDLGLFKKENNLTIFQLERWSEILQTRPDYGENVDLSREFIKRMFELIHEESIHQQTQVMNSRELPNDTF